MTDQTCGWLAWGVGQGIRAEGRLGFGFGWGGVVRGSGPPLGIGRGKMVRLSLAFIGRGVELEPTLRLLRFLNTVSATVTNTHG